MSSPKGLKQSRFSPKGIDDSKNLSYEILYIVDYEYFSLCQIWRRENTRSGGGGGGVFLGYNGKKGSTMHYISTSV